MNNNILVCGGLPRAATTFLHTEISNYENVFESRIKESYLFERDGRFIDLKLRLLNKKYIYLDFTPEYIFNVSALEKIEARKINCFFVLREYEEWRFSIEKYLSINKINNSFIQKLTESEFRRSVEHVKEKFLTFSMNDVRRDPADVVWQIQRAFNMDFGAKHKNMININSSERRIHYVGSAIHNHFGAQMKIIKSSLFGLI